MSAALCSPLRLLNDFLRFSCRFLRTSSLSFARLFAAYDGSLSRPNSSLTALKLARLPYNNKTYNFRYRNTQENVSRTGYQVKRQTKVKANRHSFLLKSIYLMKRLVLLTLLSDFVHSLAVRDCLPPPSVAAELKYCWLNRREGVVCLCVPHVFIPLFS